MRSGLLVLVSCAFRLVAYDVAVSSDSIINPQGQGGRINYIPTSLPNVSGCSGGYLCVIYDDIEFTGQSFPGAVGAVQEVAIRPLSGGTPICITCGQHAALFGPNYSATVPPQSVPANLGMPVLDPTGSWLAMEVADPVLINSYGCPDNAFTNKPSYAFSGSGYCMNIWVCKFNPSFTASDGVSTDALSNCTNETNFPDNAAGAQQGALHPRWGNNTSTQLFAWSQQDNNGTTSYCVAVEIACGQGAWSLHIGTISNGAFTPIASYSSVTGGYNGWFEPGNFGGTRSSDISAGTDNGFLTFVTNTGAYGQPWFCPDLWAVHWSDNTFSQLSTDGANCITSSANAVWNEHPTFSPDGSIISYVSSLNNGWDFTNTMIIPLDIWEATIKLSGSSASIANQTRLTYYNGNFPTQSENGGAATLVMSQMQWNLDGHHLLHITTCSPMQAGCTAENGDRELVFNPLNVGSGGVANAASYTVPVAPGSVAAIFGEFQLVGSLATSAFPIPISLGGLSLQFGSYTAPLFYAGYTQVNAQVPWELEGQTQAAVTATINGLGVAASISGQTSAPQTATLATFAPGLFTISGEGSGPGAILDSNYQTVSVNNPTTAGASIQIYCTGLGPVTHQPATGLGAPADPPSETTTVPTVTIGGVPATVQFSGLTPGEVGLYQVNVQVPAGVTPGDSVAVSLSIGGAKSNAVTIAVQ